MFVYVRSRSLCCCNFSIFEYSATLILNNFLLLNICVVLRLFLSTWLYYVSKFIFYNHISITIKFYYVPKFIFLNDISISIKFYFIPKFIILNIISIIISISISIYISICISISIALTIPLIICFIIILFLSKKKDAATYRIIEIKLIKKCISCVSTKLFAYFILQKYITCF